MLLWFYFTCVMLLEFALLTLLVASLLLLISTDCYGGRSSYKFITGDSVFYDLLERNDEVMADRGFQIKGRAYVEILQFKCSSLVLELKVKLPRLNVKKQRTLQI